jgi:uncharacterized RDD family membrane protein YckC
MENKEFMVTDDLLASKGQRFLNFIVDLLIQFIIVAIIRETIFIISDLTNSYFLTNWVESLNYMEITIIGVAIMISYYSLTEIYFSRTFAKYFTKTIVIMGDGSKPNGNTVMKRTLSRLIPFEFLSFLGSNSRGWHDMISQTYVVRKHEFNNKRGVVLFP